MRYLHIHSDADGQSHISEREWDLREEDFSPPSPPCFVTYPMPASAVTIIHHPPGYRDNWHPVPGRVFVTVLNGDVRLDTSDGDSRIVVPGDQMIFEDTAGKGHQLNEVNRQEFDFAIVRLA